MANLSLSALSVFGRSQKRGKRVEGDVDPEDEVDPNEDDAVAEGTDPEEGDADDDANAEGVAVEGDDEEEGEANPAAKQSKDYRRGLAAGRMAEQKRTADVLAKMDLNPQAHSAALLLSGGNSAASEIVAAVQGMPKAQGNALNTAMSQLGNPDIGAGGSASGSATGDEDPSARRIAAINARGGMKR